MTQHEISNKKKIMRFFIFLLIKSLILFGYINCNEKNNNAYDFIIVGAGLAGLGKLLIFMFIYESF